MSFDEVKRRLFIETVSTLVHDWSTTGEASIQDFKENFEEGKQSGHIVYTDPERSSTICLH